MKKYLQELVEWSAQRVLARVATRVVEVIGEFDDHYEDQPKLLSAPKLPEIEFR